MYKYYYVLGRWIYTSIYKSRRGKKKNIKLNFYNQDVPRPERYISMPGPLGPSFCFLGTCSRALVKPSLLNTYYLLCTVTVMYNMSL